jgi:hypothetical protein
MRIRALGLAAATAALAITTLAGSVSAVAPAGATVSVVHGIPGAVVDVCVNGKEVKSTFRYGQQFTLSGVPAGSYAIKVYPASPFKCHGTAIIRKTVAVTSGLNATLVARIISGKPGLQVFVNDTAIPTPGHATITVRHTATAPTVAVWLNGGAAPAVKSLARGASVGPVDVAPGVYSWWVSGVGAWRPVIGPRVAKLSANRAYQIYAIGTKPANYRFVVVAN